MKKKLALGSSALLLLLLISVPAPSLAGEANASLSQPAAAPDFFAPSCPEDAQQPSVSTDQSLPALPAALFPRPKCGACSVSSCRGVTLYALCLNGQPQTPDSPACVDAGICTADGSIQCECRTLA